MDPHAAVYAGDDALIYFCMAATFFHGGFFSLGLIKKQPPNMSMSLVGKLFAFGIAAVIMNQNKNMFENNSTENDCCGTPQNRFIHEYLVYLVGVILVACVFFKVDEKIQWLILSAFAGFAVGDMVSFVLQVRDVKDCTDYVCRGDNPSVQLLQYGGVGVGIFVGMMMTK